jgi:D-alanyl-D-alanine carboxypeptidase
VVQPVDARKPSLQVNEAVPMNRRPVMKLVTTLAGLEVLGPQLSLGEPTPT